MGSRMLLRFIGPVIFMLTRGSVVADTFPIVSIKGQACPLPAGMVWMTLLPLSRLMSFLVREPFWNNHCTEQFCQNDMPFLGPSDQVSHHGICELLHELGLCRHLHIFALHFLLLFKNSSIESMTWWMSRKLIGISFKASCVTSRHVATNASRACRSEAAAISYRTRLSLSDLSSGSAAPCSASKVSPVSVMCDLVLYNPMSSTYTCRVVAGRVVLSVQNGRA